MNYNPRLMDVAIASRDFWAEEYHRAARALSACPSYYHRVTEARAWLSYQAACRKIEELAADRDGVCYPSLYYEGQPIIRTDRRHHNRAIAALCNREI